MAKHKPPPVEGSPEDSIILSVRLKSGGFESTIEVPLHSKREEIDRLTSAWLDLMDAGIKMGQSRKGAP